MNENIVNILTEEWSDMSSKELSLQKMPPVEMQRLLKETYETVSFYHKFGFIPKEVVSLLFEMDHYLYFSTLVKDEKGPENFTYYKAVSSVVSAIEEGFLKGKYEYAFPELKVYDPLTEKTHIIDLENGSLEELM
jgi:hypothetical protein